MKVRKVLSFCASLMAGLLVSGVAFAQEGTAVSAGAAVSAGPFAALAVGICMGLASAIGAFGQSNAAKSALEGIARNPQAAGKVQTPMIIALAMMESLVIFAFVICIMLLGKIA